MVQDKIISTQLLDDARNIIESARETAYRLADMTLVRRNWLLGQRIAQEELAGADRADYGAQVIRLSMLVACRRNLVLYMRYRKYA